MRHHLSIHLNGAPLEVRGELAFSSLSIFLREHRRLVGTKVVCDEGDCGACTVLVGRPDGDRISYRPVNSCILHLYQLDCTHIVTVEGLKRDGVLSPVQESMVAHHGAQCGFCTPGFVVAISALFEGDEPIDEAAVRGGLTGNLCRCTGYDPIIRAALAVDRGTVLRVADMYPAFPGFPGAVHVVHEDREIFLPTTIDEAIDFRRRNPEATIVQGGTDVGVWYNKRAFSPDRILGLSAIPELCRVERGEGTLVVGGSVTLAALEELSRDEIPELHSILERFGSPQIRNVATLAGNIANASPIADLLPFLFVMGAEVELVGSGGGRWVAIDSFYTAYKRTVMAPDELITRIRIPVPKLDERLALYKVSRRHDLDISTFTAAIRMDGGDGLIGLPRIAYGGVGPVVLRLPRTEQFLSGREPTEETFREAGRIASTEISPLSDVRGSRDFRLQLAENVLLKFYHEKMQAEVSV